MVLVNSLLLIVYHLFYGQELFPFFHSLGSDSVSRSDAMVIEEAHSFLMPVYQRLLRKPRVSLIFERLVIWNLWDNELDFHI